MKNRKLNNLEEEEEEEKLAQFADSRKNNGKAAEYK